MKNYEETIQSVFEKIAERKEEKLQRRRSLLQTGVAFCCVVLALLVGITVDGQKQPALQKPEQEIDDAVSPGIQDLVEESKPESVGQEGEINRLKLQVIEELPSTENGIARMRNDFVRMNREELNKYFGINVFPSVPDDLAQKESEEQGYGIFRRDNGTGAVYWDQNEQSYSNAEHSRRVSVVMRKGNLPFFDFYPMTEEKEMSQIRGTEVWLAETTDGKFQIAEFLHKDVGFYLVFEGLSEEEFVLVIESLLQ